MQHTQIHPGEILRETVFEPQALSISDAADCLGMSRPALSRVLNGHAAISPDLAIRLESAGIGSARAWVALQANYDLWRAMQHPQPPIKQIQFAHAA
ncbi:MAG: HigA family addiction module antidote protein [Zoogloeaceae bacterium]|jgi:addiction module HigA family antidote|nr:HigA family addiction module antidote protein [Zoogloeaceae bacterium]